MVEYRNIQQNSDCVYLNLSFFSRKQWGIPAWQDPVAYVILGSADYAFNYKGNLMQLPGETRFGDHEVVHHELYGTLLLGAESRPKTGYPGHYQLALTDGQWFCPLFVLTPNSKVFAQTVTSSYGVKSQWSFGPFGSGFVALKSTPLNSSKTFQHVADAYSYENGKIAHVHYSWTDGKIDADISENYKDPLLYSKVRSKPSQLRTSTVRYYDAYPSDFCRILEGKCSKAVASYVTMDEEARIKGRLSQEAANSAKVVDTNLWTTIPEVVGFKSGLNDLVGLWHHVLSERTAKSLSNAYLSTLYGPRLTVMDLQQQAKSILDNARKLWYGEVGTVYATEHTSYAASMSPLYGNDIDVLWTLKVYYKANPFLPGANSFLDALSRFSALPQLTDAWDMVPFSFVIDWFADIEGLLDDIDSRVTISTLPVFYALYGVKAKVSLDVFDGGAITFFGRYERYTRLVDRTLTLPRLELDVHPSNVFGHVPESTALIIQSIN